MKKFTLNEVTRLTGRLSLYALPFFCEICDDKQKVEMALVTATGVPICTCLNCASKLVTISSKRQELNADAKRQPRKAIAKRGRPRKVA